MKILVTGAAGFIGSHLTDKLLAEGFEVVGLDNFANGKLDNLVLASQNPHFKLIEGDILNKETCLLASQNIDYVFHLACLGVRHSLHSPFLNHQVNAEGTLNVLEAAKISKVKHVFYISTSEIYGKTTVFPITESSPTCPLTVYGASKLVGEHYAHAYNECFGLTSTVFRIFNNYGPRAHYEGDAGEVIPRSIVKILYNEQPMVFGDGSVTRDFFYVKDTANALFQMLQIKIENKQNIDGQTINIGTGVEYSMKMLLENLLQVMSKESLGINYLPDRPADVPRLWVDASKFYKMTDFKANFSFQEGLKETVDFYTNLAKNKDLLAEVAQNNWKK